MDAKPKQSRIKEYKGIKRILPKTLFFRSLLILITPIFLIQIILTVVFFDRHWGKMTTRLAYAVSGEIALVVSYIDDNESRDDIDRII